MQVVILAAGEGTRCRPYTKSKSKVMIPVGNRPILHHVIDALKSCGVDEIIIVVGYKKERIMDYFEDGMDFGVKIKYVVQEKQLGTAHSLKQVEGLVDDQFFVVNGDNIIDRQTFQDLLDGAGGDASLLTTIRSDVSGYGIVVWKNGRVSELLEKPTYYPSYSINTGMYRFSKAVFEEIDETGISERGDYEITNTIQNMIKKGYDIRSVSTTSTWFDVVYPWDLIKVNGAILKGLDGKVKGTIENGVEMRGPVSIGKNTIIRSGTYIIGPVSIGENCEIGPFVKLQPSTSIGNNVIIDSFSTVYNSVLMDDVRVGPQTYLCDSVIGQGTAISSHFANEWKEGVLRQVDDSLIKVERMGAVIGESCQIERRVIIDGGVVIGNRCRIGSNVKVTEELEDESRVM